MANGSTTVLTTSTLVVPERPPNARRRKLVITNDSDTKIYLCQGIAVSQEGVPLASGGTFVDQPDNTGYLYQGSWSAICSATPKVLSWYEEYV